MNDSKGATKVPFVSIIIPVYNGRRFLERCLDAVVQSEYKAFELIVVDDCSTDDSAEFSRSKGALVLNTSERSGPAAARNYAARTAKGEILMFVDADVVVKRHTIGNMAKWFENGSDVAAVFGSYDDEPAEPNFLSQYKNLQHHFVHQSSSSEASTFWSGLGAMRKDVFLTHGGFDCSLFSKPSIEDIELGVRVISSGHRIILDKNIQGKHLKKWEFIPLLKTEILGRALPWSKLILERRELINDLNLKRSDRVSAVLVVVCLLLLPISFWQPIALFALVACLALIGLLNHTILRFFARKKGVVFAFLTFPLQLFYYFYSAATFVACWAWYTLRRALGYRTREAALNDPR